VRGVIKNVIIATDGSVVSDEAARRGFCPARKSGARADAVYVVDMTRLARLHGYASFSGIKDSLLRETLEEGPKATGHVENLTAGVQVPLEKRSKR